MAGWVKRREVIESGRRTERRTTGNTSHSKFPSGQANNVYLLPKFRLVNLNHCRYTFSTDSLPLTHKSVMFYEVMYLFGSGGCTYLYALVSVQRDNDC